MLTKRQNLIECIRGGSPDRYVNQFEAFSPMIFANPLGRREVGDGSLIDEWGVTFRPIEGQPGLFPDHDAAHLVVDDVAKWRDAVTPPGAVNDPALWETASAAAERIDRNEQFVTCAVFPGIFERVHHLHGITDTLADFYEEPEAIHDLIACITDWELRLAEGICTYVKPDCIFHHDDWGMQKSTFMSPEMFEEFLLEPYKQVYGYYKDHGVELIVHHSDSYCESFVRYMIELGIDIWQGALRTTNDIPGILERYAGKIAVMGGIETQLIDKPGWTPEEVRAEVETAFETIGRKRAGWIPCLTQGGEFSGFPGVYDEVTRRIAEMSERDFG